MGILDIFTGKRKSSGAPTSAPDPFASPSPNLNTMQSPNGAPGMPSPSGMPSQSDPFSSSLGNDPLGKPIGSAGDSFGSSSSPSTYATGPQAPSNSGNYMPGVGMPSNNNTNNLPEPGSSFSTNHDTPFPNSMPPDPTVSQSGLDAKNIELILSKLDTIRVSIQNLDHRLTKIEEQTSIRQQQNGGGF